MGLGTVAKAACVILSLGMAVAAACADAGDSTNEAPEVILPPEKTWEEAGLNEPGAAEMSNLVNAPRIPDGEEPRAWHYASDNGGMSARAELAGGGAKTAPPLSDAVPRSGEADPLIHSWACPTSVEP
jgi:hypothetical protein